MKQQSYRSTNSFDFCCSECPKVCTIIFINEVNQEAMALGKMKRPAMVVLCDTLVISFAPKYQMLTGDIRTAKDV